MATAAGLAKVAESISRQLARKYESKRQVYATAAVSYLLSAVAIVRARARAKSYKRTIREILEPT